MNKLMIGVAALAVAVPALAQVSAPLAPPPQPPMAAPYAPHAPMAPMAGRDQTRDQVVAKVRDHFARLDTNRDGYIAKDEMEAMRSQHQGMRRERRQQMAMRDGPRGGAMRGAIERQPGAAFDRIDANKDGVISRDEFGRARELRQQRRMVMHGQPGAGTPGMGADRGRRMMKMHRMGGRIGGHMLRMADLDRDGRVSMQEATTSALQHFDRVDVNRDGRITPDERRSMRQKMREDRGRRG